MGNAQPGDRMAARQITILCLGDSLTEGYYGTFPAVQFHPYSERLGQVLALKAPSLDFTLVNEGVSGEKIDAIEWRLREGIMCQRGFQAPDLAILLMGTNDLSDSTAEQIAEGTKRCHEALRKAGTRTIAINIPTHGAEWANLGRFLRPVRESANALLKEYCEANDIRLVDLARTLPHYDEYDFVETAIGGRGFNQWWYDQLHFCPDGYDAIADMLVEPVLQALTTKTTEQ